MFNLFGHTTYSFLDLSGVICHPKVNSYVFTGQGVGRVSVTMEEDKTFHDIGVDGTVIIGKIPGGAGKLTIDCQQTSNIHKWLLFTYQFLIKEDAKEWGRITAFLRNLNDGTQHTLKGMSFERIPEKSYQAEGQMVTWVLWAADIDSFAPDPSGAGQLSALAKRWISRFKQEE
jgi:hypothetical protein